MSRFVTWIERRHRLVVAVSVVVSVAAALSLARLRLDMDVLGMLPEGREAFDDFKSFVVDFGQLDELLILIDGAPTSRLESFADAFAVRLRDLDSVQSVQARIEMEPILRGLLGESLPNYIPLEDYSELEARLTPSGIDDRVGVLRGILSAPFDLAAAQSIRADPLGMRQFAASALAESGSAFRPDVSSGAFLSRSRDALLMFVRPTRSAFDIAFSERLMAAVRATETETRRHVGGKKVRVRYTGSYVYAMEDAKTLRSDIARYVVLALLAVLLVFYLGYGNLRVLPFVTYPLLVTTLLTFALSLVLYDRLNAVSISFAAILYGLSIDSCIHFYSRLIAERERRSGDLAGAVAATIAGLGRANAAGTLTTAASFLIAGLSCLTAVRQLGVLTALGMGITLLQFYTLYPALAFSFPGATAGRLEAGEARRLERWASRAVAHSRIVVAMAALFGIGSLLAARHVELDVGLMNLRPRDSEAARVQEEIASKFGDSADGGAVLVRHADIEEALQRSETVAEQIQEYQREGLVRQVQSIAPILPSAAVQQARLDRYNALPRSEVTRNLRASLQRRGFLPEPFDNFFAWFREPRSDVVRIGDPVLDPVGFLVDHHVRRQGGEYIVATYLDPADPSDWPTIADRLRTDLPVIPFQVAARGLLEQELGAVLRDEIRLFLVLGIAVNLLLLFLIVGNLATATAILAPVVLALLMVLALMSLAGIALDPVNIVVVPLLLGIGVDDGVYVALDARRQQGIADAVRRTGRALAITSLTTIAGLGFLALSRYPPLATMGLLVVLGVFLCLASSITLLPSLLSLARGRGAPECG